jgi:hypothetical protein
MAVTILNPSSLVGAADSPWNLLRNASIKFTRILATDGVDSQGNPKVTKSESLTVPAYFKKARIVNDVGRGVPLGSYNVEGYTVGILPDWAKEASAAYLECTIDHLGTGFLSFQGKIHVVKDEVEQAGQGSQIQGYFTIQGGQ